MTSRRRFLRSLAAAGVAGSTGLAGCGYRPGGGDIRWRSDEFRSPFRQSRLALADGLLVAVADSTMDYDLEAEEWHRGGQVVAYATDDGSEAWTARLEAELTCHAVGDGGAAVGFDRAVVRYGADGELWRASLPEPPVALAVADGRIYALTETGALVACGEGEVLWRVDLEPALGADERGFGPTVAADAETVVCWVGGVALGVDPDGSRRWEQTEVNPRQFVLVDGTVFAGAGHGLATLDAATGELRWLTGDGVGDFAVTDDAVYGTVDGDVVAYARSGDRRWSTGDGRTSGHNRAPEGSDYMGRVAADASGVYVDSLGGLSALDPADGAVRWRVGNRSLSAGPFLAPSGVLVVAESDLVCHYREDTF